MRPRGAGSHTVRISPILILIFFCQRSVERGEAPTPEREGNKGGGKRERRGEREGRSRRAPSTTEQGGPGQATQPPTRTRTTERRERGERERGERERGERDTTSRAPKTQQTPNTKMRHGDETPNHAGRSREERPPHQRERGTRGGGKRERRGEREGRSRRAPSTTEQGGPGQATQPPTRTRTTERRERGERERGERERGERDTTSRAPKTQQTPNTKMRMVIDAVWLKSLTPPCAREEQAHTQYGSLQY